MGKLHEVLAVEGDQQTLAKKIVAETVHVFERNSHLFLEEVTATSYFDDSEKQLNATETKAMTTTVKERLGYTAKPVARYFDTFFSKEASNSKATADVVLDGTVIFSQVPATVLLGMESRLREMRDMYDKIPTLQAGIRWEKDSTSRDVFISEDPEVRNITRQSMEPVVMYPATPEHPAQVKAVEFAKNVGKKEITRKSGMMTSAEKSDMLERLDKLLVSVKRARQVANGVEAVKAHGFGEAVMGYINNGQVPTPAGKGLGPFPG